MRTVPLVSALAVPGTGRGWPDAAVAGVTALLALGSGLGAVRDAWRELAQAGGRALRRAGVFGTADARRGAEAR